MTTQQRFRELWKEAARAEHPEILWATIYLKQGLFDTFVAAMNFARKAMARREHFQDQVEAIARNYRLTIRPDPPPCEFCKSLECLDIIRTYPGHLTVEVLTYDD